MHLAVEWEDGMTSILVGVVIVVVSLALGPLARAMGKTPTELQLNAADPEYAQRTAWANRWGRLILGVGLVLQGSGEYAGSVWLMWLGWGVVICAALMVVVTYIVASQHSSAV